MTSRHDGEREPEEPTKVVHLDEERSSAPPSTHERALRSADDWDRLEEEEVLAAVQAKMFSGENVAPLSVSRYVLLRRIGSGAAGVVYQAYDPELDRQVAVKVLRTSRHLALTSSNARERFVREARVVAKFSHPNVIAVHDVGTFEIGSEATRPRPEGDELTGKGVFIVMEMVVGDNLHTWLEARPRSWQEVLRVFLAAGRGLAAAHEAGIVHRDFKPSNVLLRSAATDRPQDADVKVADFGLAVEIRDRSRGDSASGELADAPDGVVAWPDSAEVERTENGERLTATGTVLGTPAYMAPEQQRGEEADASSDQYAFCVALYRALCGRLPFEDARWADLYDAKIRGAVSFDRAGSVPTWLRKVVLRGLQADPSRRFPSMRAVLAALEADPWRRLGRIVGAVSLPIGLAGLVWAAVAAFEPGVVRLAVEAGGHPLSDYAVSVDAEPVETAAGEDIVLSAGRHLVEVTAPDHERAVELVEVGRGSTHELRIVLQHDVGMLDVEVEPRGGTIFVDGVDRGSRLANFPIDTGSHDLLIRHVGHYDQRLSLDVALDARVRGFSALSEAIVWSESKSGAMGNLAWVGDLDGDGFGDLIHRHFATLSLYDPWNDETLATRELSFASIVLPQDLDGDGDQELLVASWVEGGTEIEALDGPVRDGKFRALWSARLRAESDVRFLAGGIAVGDLDGDGVDDVAVMSASGRLVGLRGSTGRRLFSRDLPSLPYAVAIGRGSSTDQMFVLGERHLQAFDLPGAVPRWTVELPPISTNEGDAQSQRAELGWLNGPHERIGRLLLRVRDDGEPPDLAFVRRLAGTRFELEVRSTGDGAKRWTTSMATSGPGRDLGDVDGDRVPELLLATGGGTHAVLSGATGDPLWSADVRGGVTALPWDGEPAIVSWEGPELRVLDPRTGRPTRSTTLGEPIRSALRVFDWDGDGREELALVTGTRGLTLVGHDLGLAASALLPVGPQTIAEPVDADRDGFLDLLVDARGPAVIRGPKIRWWRSTTDAIRGAPVAHDIDGDGTFELAISAELEGRPGFYVLDAATGGFVVGLRDGSGGNAIRGPQLLRRPDGGADFVAQAGNSVERFRGEDGVRVAHAPIPHSYTRPAVGDIDGDGVLEVLDVGWETPARVYVMDAETLEIRREVPMPEGGWGQPAIDDFTGDGEIDVAVTRHDGTVMLFDPRTWQEHWSTPTGDRLAFGVTPIPRPGGGFDIVVAPNTKDGRIVYISGRDGSIVWTLPERVSGSSRPEVADIDGDGKPEIFVAGHGNVSAIGQAGVPRWETMVMGVDGVAPHASAPVALSDLEGDGGLEVLTGWSDGTLRVFDADTGEAVWVFHTRGKIEATPVAVDVDGDGIQEVIVASHDRRLYCVNHPARSRER